MPDDPGDFLAQGRPVTRRVAAVIVNFNQRDHLRRCLSSVLEALAAVDGPSEVVVVDNGSVDGAPDMVRQAFPEVRLIERGYNSGFPPAAAEGIRATDSDWI